MGIPELLRELAGVEVAKRLIDALQLDTHLPEARSLGGGKGFRCGFGE
jgi:hypothetical protein